MAPQVGLEPTTLRLTAECSTIELLRTKVDEFISFNQTGGTAVKLQSRASIARFSLSQGSITADIEPSGVRRPAVRAELAHLVPHRLRQCP